MRNKLQTRCLENLKTSGITIKQMEEKKRGTWDNLARCFWNGLVIFLFTVGLAGMFVSSFNMPCNYPVMIMICAVSSFTPALLYVNSLTYYLGYFSLMFIIILSTVSFVVFINSGYNAVLNILTEAVKEEMNLPYLREHMEMYGNREVSITAFMSLIGCVVALFFNMWVSRRRSVVYPLLVVIPVLEVCIYLSDDFSYICLMVILLAIGLFIWISRNDPVQMDKKKMRMPWHTRKQHLSGSKDKTLTVVLHQEKPERKGGAAAILLYVVAVLLVSQLCFGFVSRRFLVADSTLKKSSDRVVKTVAMQGFEGLFMRDSSRGTGGMSDGSFGNVSSVYLDYETDLEITLVPYTDRPVYLPTYTGAVYDSDKRQWTNDGVEQKYGYGSSYELMKKVVANGDWEEYEAIDTVMLIKNVGVDYSGESPSGDGGFSGYYSDKSIRVPIVQSEDDYTELEYYACLLGYNEYAKLENYSDITADDSIRDIYTQVPDNIYGELQRICDREGFKGSKSQVIRQIQRYLASNCQYTVAPGKTPAGRDFVLYFLEDKKEGFCVHFASLACLLLRTMGIPARYAEGYCFDYTVYEDAELYEGEHTKWNTGYSELDYDSPVTVELADSNAHAWVEVYFDEIGWVPVEFTVGTVSDGEMSGIMEFLGGLFAFGSPTVNIGNTNTDGNFLTNAGNAIQNWFESRFVEQIIIIIGIVLAFFLIKYIIYLVRAYLSKPDYRAVFQYRTLVRRARKRLKRHNRDMRDYYDSLVISYDVMRTVLTEEYGLDYSYVNDVMSAYERFNYSGRESDRDIQQLTKMYRKLRFRLIKKVFIYDKKMLTDI